MVKHPPKFINNFFPTFFFLNEDYYNMSDTTSTENGSKRTTDKAADQPLKRSTYNIYEAYETNMSIDYSMDPSSVHPLQVSPYAHDLSPDSQPKQPADLNTMMQELDLSPKKCGMNSMPYCT